MSRFKSESAWSGARISESLGSGMFHWFVTGCAGFAPGGIPRVQNNQAGSNAADDGRRNQNSSSESKIFQNPPQMFGMRTIFRNSVLRKTLSLWSPLAEGGTSSTSHKTAQAQASATPQRTGSRWRTLRATAAGSGGSTRAGGRRSRGRAPSSRERLARRRPPQQLLRFNRGIITVLALRKSDIQKRTRKQKQPNN